MFRLPDAQTIPYHLGWAGFALGFGLGTWTRSQLVLSLGWYTLATGVALERSWLLGRIGWDETSEIPLMFLLAILLVWHVRRRQSALAQVTRLAAHDAQSSQDRERLMQLTSHELRTPLTIARGYVELLEMRAVHSEDKQDLYVVADELDRLSRVSDRLVRMIRLRDDTTSEIFDVDQVMAQVVGRWRAVVNRHWVLDARAGLDLGSPERLRTCLDTLVENAIRYTSAGDTIRLAGSRHSHNVVVGVYDAGAGLTDHQVFAINAGELSPLPGAAAGTMADTVDRLAGTGLGLSIVQETALSRGGTLHASHAPEGGAALTLTFPIGPSVEGARAAPRVVPGPGANHGDLPHFPMARVTDLAEQAP
jgi:signal transduction histidine kinase